MSLRADRLEFADRGIILARMSPRALLELGALRTTESSARRGKPPTPLSAGEAYYYEALLNSEVRTQDVHNSWRVHRYAKTPGRVLRYHPAHI